MISAKYWNNELKGWLYNNNLGNFKGSTSETILFAYDNGNTWLKFIFYIDDGLYYGDSESTEKQFFE